MKQDTAWVDPDDAPALRRGRPPTGNAKELISLRLDQDVLGRLREMGPGWQSKVNDVLRKAVGL